MDNNLNPITSQPLTPPSVPTPAPVQNTTPTPIQPTAPIQPPHDKKFGPIIATLIIIVLLIIAGLYFFGKKLNTEEVIPSDTSSLQETSAITASEQSQTVPPSTKDEEISNISADLDAQLGEVDYSF